MNDYESWKLESFKCSVFMISESSKQFGGVRNVRMLYTAGHITELCILCKGQLLGRGPVQHSLNIYITVSLISVSDSLSLVTLANTWVLSVASSGSGADSAQIVASRLSEVRCWLMASWGNGGGLAWRFMTTTRSLVVPTIRQVPKCLVRACMVWWTQWCHLHLNIMFALSSFAKI